MTIKPNEKQSQVRNLFSKFHAITKRIITTIDLIIVFINIYLYFLTPLHSLVEDPPV